MFHASGFAYLIIRTKRFKTSELKVIKTVCNQMRGQIIRTRMTGKYQHILKSSNSVRLLELLQSEQMQFGFINHFTSIIVTTHIWRSHGNTKLTARKICPHLTT
jgi:hypothetical protein